MMYHAQMSPATAETEAAAGVGDAAPDAWLDATVDELLKRGEGSHHR
jgi:hypothetical protein